MSKIPDQTIEQAKLADLLALCHRTKSITCSNPLPCVPGCSVRRLPTPSVAVCASGRREGLTRVGRCARMSFSEQVRGAMSALHNGQFLFAPHICIPVRCKAHRQTLMLSGIARVVIWFHATFDGALCAFHFAECLSYKINFLSWRQGYGYTYISDGGKATARSAGIGD